MGRKAKKLRFIRVGGRNEELHAPMKCYEDFFFLCFFKNSVNLLTVAIMIVYFGKG